MPKQKWSWDPLEANLESGGANVWSLIRTDPRRNLVFLPTGSASPDYFGGLRPGDNLYANSMVALNGRTGKRVWHFQTVHHDLWDYDVATPAAFFTIERKGKSVPAVAVGSKTGHLFLLHRESGKPLFPVEERRVPQTDIPEEKTAATQPFPSLPPPLVAHNLNPEDVWGPTPADRDWCRDQLQALRNEGIFTPPSRKGSLIIPGNVGGLHWGGIAFDETRGLLIVPVNQMPAVVRLIPRNEVAEYRRNNPEWETTSQTGAPYAMSRTFLRSPSGLPCSPPPFGVLVAVDAQSGQIRWRVPLGRLPLPRNPSKGGARPAGRLAGAAQGSDTRAPAEWGSLNLGGPIVTKTGVVFIGAALDPVLRAFDAETGKELWQGPLPASARSVPTTYLGSDGKQYVVIAAGGHDPTFGPLDNAVVAFTLGE